MSKKDGRRRPRITEISQLTPENSGKHRAVLFDPALISGGSDEFGSIIEYQVK